MFCPLWCATTTEYPCQGHPSSQRSPAPDIYARRWGSSFLINLELYLPFSHVWDELRGRRRPRGEVGERRKRIFLLAGWKNPS